MTANTSPAPGQPDRVVSRPELECALERSSETIRRWIKDGTLPRPDVDLTRKTKGWRLSTLVAAGIRVV
jgi:predicted DNA-binding transcriptional regulator AlpA